MFENVIDCRRKYVFLLSLLVVACIGCSCSEPSPREYGSLALMPGVSEGFSFQVGEEETSKQTLALEYGLSGRDLRSLTINKITFSDKRFSVYGITMPITVRASYGFKVPFQFDVKGAERKEYKTTVTFDAPNASNADENGQVKWDITAKPGMGKARWECGGAIYFGIVPLGEVKTKDCRLQNIGTGSIRIKSVTYKKEEGGETPDINMLLPKSLPVTLRRGQKLNFSFQFLPTGAALIEDKGTFVFDVEFAEEKTITLNVSGFSGGGAVVSLLPLYPNCTKQDDCTSIHEDLSCHAVPGRDKKWCVAPDPLMAFPSTSVGKTSRGTLSILNYGDKTLTIEAIKLDEKINGTQFRLLTDALSLPLTLEAGKTIEFDVEYKPINDKGEKNTFTIKSSTGTHVVTLLAPGNN